MLSTRQVQVEQEKEKEKEREEDEAGCSTIDDDDSGEDSTHRKRRSTSKRTRTSNKMVISNDTSSSSSHDESPKNKRKRDTTATPSPNKVAKKSATQTPVFIDLKDDDEYYISKSPFYNRGAREIVENVTKELSEIMHQDTAIEDLIYRTYARTMTPSRDTNAAQRILSLHLTGGSGIGKTRSAEKLAYALGVGPGTPYPKHYHRVNLSKYSDQSHAVAITGAAQGLVGYNDENLVSKLMTIVKDKKDAPFLVLHLDEACKAHPAFINGLNPLLSEGTIANIKEETFTVPNETLLIILWTSNFAEGIKDPHDDPEKATRYVYDLMRKKGYDHCDIARMGGDPIFYKQLTPAEMYCIIEKNGNTRLPHHPFSRQFGVPSYRVNNDVEDTDTDMDIDKSSNNTTVKQQPLLQQQQQPNILIRNIMKTYKPELGVRHPLEKYKGELDALLTVADLMATLGVIDKTKKRKKNINPPEYWCKQIKITAEDRADIDQFLIEYPEIAIAIKQNHKNRIHFKRIFSDTTQNVLEYAVLKFYKDKYKMLAYSILQPVSDKDIRAAISLDNDNDNDTEDCHNNNNNISSSSSSCEEVDTESVMIIKLQNEVLLSKYEALAREFKSMKCQLDVLYINQRASCAGTGDRVPLYQSTTTTTTTTKSPQKAQDSFV